jgi:methylase of polypeptide subunit release factors
MSVEIPNNEEITLDSGIILNYPLQLNGGGLELKSDFIKIIQEDTKRVYKNGYEWCSGFGAIGFELFGKRVCENIHFSDKFDMAIENNINNAKRNNIANNVFTYLSDNVKDLPVENLFDLVVGNGPCDFDLKGYTESRLKSENRKSTSEMRGWDTEVRLNVDNEYKIHREFFNNIAQKITQDADILIVVNSNRNDLVQGSLDENNFKLIKKIPISIPGRGDIWYIKLTNESKVK